jgi:hypothetical protein
MKRLHGGLLLAAVMVAFIAACTTMQSRWDATKSADTITAYEDFLKEHPEGDLADQARVRRNELYEERDWKDAEASNTIAAYEDFIKNYPKGRHKNDAHARIEKLSLSKANDLPLAITEKYHKRYPQGVFKNDALLTQEKLSAEQAQAKDTILAYDEYLNRYPQGSFADEARLRREKLIAISSSVSEWGTIMYPRSNTNIRANRSTASKLKGQLKTGQPVKVDFLQNAWYAVFPMTQKQRDEKAALGYVYAPLLIEKRKPNSSGSTASEGKSAKDTPPKKTETDNLSVDMKNITFKVAGDGKELLLIEFDRFYTPAIFGIEGKEPLIILEIKNISLLREEWATINTGGNFIRQIRTSIDSQTRSALIVLNMAPEKDYFVNQTFYQKENMYSLEISEKNETRLP